MLTLPTYCNPQYLRALFIYKGLQTGVGEGLLEKLPNLRILLLTDLNVQELPHSIGNLLHLRHLDLDRSRITKIPNSIGRIANLQTLRAGSCYSLSQLLETITRLYNLRFLHVQNTPLTHVPKGIGQLRKLNTIRGLVIGHSSDLREEHERACELEDIKFLSNLRSLRLHMLHRSKSEATTTLADKKYLKSLVLSETVLFDNEAPTLSEEQIRRSQKIYDDLSPPPRLEELMILNFPAVEFPIWMMSASLGDSFPNLTTLSIRNAKSCGKLPPQLCRLPQLKNVRITGNDAVVKIGPEFFGNEPEVVAFPKLETLRIEKMTSLEEWSSRREGLQSSSLLLPKLIKLLIIDCSKLKSLPECLSLATNLKTLDVLNCSNLESVGNLHAVENFSLKTSEPRLPRWLPNLVLQHQFKKFFMHCTLGLLKDCLRDGPNWDIIGQIPDVKIEDVDSNKYLSYTKRKSGSYQTNVPQ